MLVIILYSEFRSLHVHYLWCDREFVNSVGCIKILSPEEMQQMGNNGLGLLNSVPIQRLSNGFSDDYTGPDDPRNSSSGITTVGSLDY